MISPSLWNGQNQNYLAAMALARNEQQLQQEMFFPTHQQIASKSNIPIFDHPTPISSTHCCVAQQAQPSTIPSNIDICSSKAKEEMMPPGFWRQLADLPPPSQALPVQIQMMAAQPPFIASSNPTILYTTPPSAAFAPFLSYSFVTVPPIIQSHNQAYQFQLLWMANLFRQAASIAEQSGNVNIGGGNSNGQQQSIIGQQQRIKTIVGPKMNNILKERPPKQLSTEIIVQSPSSEIPTSAIPTTILMNEEMQRKRDFLFLHSLSPTPPAFRRHPGIANQNEPQPNHHLAESNAVPISHPNKQMMVCRPQNGIPFNSADQNEFDSSNPFCSSLLAPPELKSELLVGGETELLDNAWQKEEEDDDDGDQQFARMPKLEPQTEPPPPSSILNIEQIMDDNEDQQKMFKKEEHQEEEEDQQQEKSSDENCAELVQNVASPTAPSTLFPPLPPLLISFRIQQNRIGQQKSEKTNEEWKQPVEQCQTNSLSFSSSFSSKFSDSSATTSSGVSSAGTVNLDSPQEEDEMKENKKIMEEGGMVKRRKRRRAPKLLIVKRKNAIGKCGGKNHNNKKIDGRKNNGRKRRLTQRQNDMNCGKHEEENCEIFELPKKQRTLLAEQRNGKCFPKLRIDSNWRPIGNGIKKKPVEDAKEEKLCFEEIQHKNVPNVCIRLGDCVLVNSADDEEDIFVGRVIAIHYEKEKRALQLNLLWFYTIRQLPIRQPDAKILDHRELFASKHLDTINADSVKGIAYVLTFAEYCRYRAQLAINHLPISRQKIQQNRRWPCESPNYHRKNLLPKMDTPPEMVFYCRGIFSIRTKRLSTIPKKAKATHGLRPIVCG